MSVSFDEEELGHGVYLCCGVGGDIVAGGLHQEAESGEGSHKSKSFGTTYDIEHLGCGKLQNPAQDVGDDADGADQLVQGEGADDVGREVARDLLLQRIDEVDQQDTRRVLLAIALSMGVHAAVDNHSQDICPHERGFGPSQRDGFDLLGAALGVLVGEGDSRVVDGAVDVLDALLAGGKLFRSGSGFEVPHLSTAALLDIAASVDGMRKRRIRDGDLGGGVGGESLLEQLLESCHVA